MKVKSDYRLKLFFISSFLLIVSLQFTKAQSIIENSIDKKISIGIEAGASASFIGKDVKEATDELVSKMSENETKEADFSGKNPIKFSPFFGVFADYQFNEKISFRGGVRWHQKGYNLDIKGETKDPEYQFDHNFKYHEKYRLKTLEVPLSAYLSLSDRIKINASTIIGFPSKNSSKMEVSISQEVIINGEYADDFSEGTATETFDLNEAPKGVYLGLSFGFDFKIYTNLNLATSIQRIGNYAELEGYGKLKDTTITLSLNYALPVY